MFGIVIPDLNILGFCDVLNKTFISFMELQGEIMGSRSSIYRDLGLRDEVKMEAIINIKWGHLCRFLDDIIISEFSEGKQIMSVVLLI